MAGTGNTYKVEVNYNGKGSQDDKGPIEDDADSLKEDSKPGAGGKRVGVRAALAKTSGIFYFGKSLIDYGVRRVNVEAGNFARQQQYAAWSGLVGQVMAVGAATVFGGPAGLALAGGGIALSYAKKAYEMNYEQREETVALGILRGRAGASNRSR